MEYDDPLSDPFLLLLDTIRRGRSAEDWLAANERRGTDLVAGIERAWRLSVAPTALLEAVGLTRDTSTFISATCAAARVALRYVSSTEPRPRTAIELAERSGHGQRVAREDLHAAANAARAAGDGCGSSASYAADAAAGAARVAEHLLREPPDLRFAVDVETNAADDACMAVAFDAAPADMENDSEPGPSHTAQVADAIRVVVPRPPTIDELRRCVGREA